MFKFCKLTEKEFDEFSRKHKNKCFLQSIAVSNLRKRNGWDSHLLGVKDDNKIVGATLLISKKRRIKNEFYSLRGPLINFENDELLTFFIENIKKYVKEKNGYMLRIDPYIEAKSLDKDGKETNEFDNTKYKETLKKLGFKEVIAKEMLDTVQAKFMYVIDINDNLENIISEMDPKTRQMIHKNEKAGIVIREGSIDDIPLFTDIMNHTSERRHFTDRGIKFYQDIYECLIKDNMISLVFAELDIDLARKNISKEKEEIDKSKKDREEKRRIGKCNEKKAAIKEKEENQILDNLLKREEELKILEEQHGKKITLGGILYILYEDEVASLYGGSYEEFKKYQPFYTIHYEMIKKAIDNGAKRYNFYAINNHLDEKDNQYGIYLFKRGFGGHVVEFLGEFILPIDKFAYNFQKLLKSIRKILKREKS